MERRHGAGWGVFLDFIHTSKSLEVNQIYKNRERTDTWGMFVHGMLRGNAKGQVIATHNDRGVTPRHNAA